jgi:hypothetical protein
LHVVQDGPAARDQAHEALRNHREEGQVEGPVLLSGSVCARRFSAAARPLCCCCRQGWLYCRSVRWSLAPAVAHASRLG